MRDCKSATQRELKAQYALYYGLLGAVIPFWSLFLHARGFTAQQVGVLVSLFGAARIVCPTLWGALADRAQGGGNVQQAWINLVCVFLAFLTFVPILFYWSYPWMAVWVLLYGACWSGIAPLLETRCVKVLAGEMSQYGGIRLWGSLGFLVMVLASGHLFDWVAVDVGLPWLIIGGLFCLLLLALAVVKRAKSDALKENLVPETLTEDTLSSESLLSEPLGVTRQSLFSSDSRLGVHPKHNELGWSQLLKQPNVWVFLSIVCLVALSHGPFYTFLAVYLDELGYNRTAIGALWAIGVAAEILAFNWLRTRSKVPSTDYLMTIAISAAVLRWGLMMFVPIHWLILVFAQLLHAATFGAMHVASISRVHELFQGRHHAKGQGLYASLGLATGASLGALWSGFSWSWLGSTQTFAVASLLALIALLLLFGQLFCLKTTSPSKSEYERSQGNRSDA